MRNQKRRRPAQNKDVDDESNSSDFISSMPDDILVMILYLLPIKYAAVTSSLSQRWRSVWRNLKKLNFDDTDQNSKKITRDRRRVTLRDHQRYLDQVEGVINSYKHRMVQEFRIRSNLNNHHQEHIDSWLEFAVKKKVETIELALVDNDGPTFAGAARNYNFPLRLSHRNTKQLFKWPSSNAKLVEIVYLKQLLLKNVNVREEILQEFLVNSPHLETISIHGSGFLINIRVGGQPLSLKHFEIHECPFVKSIYLFDFGLETFAYKGGPIYLKLANLPNISELSCQGYVGFENNVFKQISTCALSLQVLSFLVHHPKRLNLNRLPNLPNLKKLTLTIRAHEDESLLELITAIAKACLSLESLTIKLLWCTPIKRRRKRVMHVATYRHEYLSYFQILGYLGRISDLELATYVIQNAALKKIIIDPRFQVGATFFSAKDFLKDEKRARSLAKKQLVPISPPGVSLVIL